MNAPSRHAPTVSVCIPAYNSARFVGEAVESVLAQTFEDFELVIVDDASPDGTLSVIESFRDDRIRVFRHDENIGATANWNRVVSLARGRLVKVLCGDDTIRPTCLAEQVGAMDRHPEVALVAGRRDVVDEKGRVLLAARGLSGLSGVVDSRMAIRATVRSGTNIFGEPASVLMRTELIERCGPFSGRHPYMIDLDYWCRLLRFGPLFAHAHTVGAFRVNLGSWSVQLARHQSDQAIGLFRELHEQDPGTVTRRDLALGRARARTMALARGASYWALGLLG